MLVTTATAGDTRRAAVALADLLVAGDVVVLVGPLGAGKTTFVQGLAAGLGIDEPVTSPTFVLVHEMPGGRVPLVHVDAYRLGSAWELDDLDLDTALTDAVVAVEWGAGLVERLSDSHLEVRLERAGDEARRLQVLGVGPRWEPVDLNAAGRS